VDHVCDIVREFDGVRLTNSHANADVTAQFSVDLALALLNRLHEGHELVKYGRWDERWSTSAPVNMSESTVGVLGAGRIGHEIARLARPFAARVVGLSRRGIAADDTFDRIVGSADMDWILQETDILFVTLPLTEDTRDLIGRRELDLLGPSGYLISVGRGASVNEVDLFEALRDLRIAGAAVDVWFEYEPAADGEGHRYPFHLPFHTLDNVLLSPHRAGWTSPAPDYWHEIIENLRRFASDDGELLNEVDLRRGY
jgi:phosphoglycerate dehydrogenase-like enzyme